VKNMSFTGARSVEFVSQLEVEPFEQEIIVICLGFRQQARPGLDDSDLGWNLPTSIPTFLEWN